MVAHFSLRAGADLTCHAEEDHLLQILTEIERIHNQIVNVERAFAIKRLRMKLRGRRMPSKREFEALEAAVEAIVQSSGLFPADSKMQS